MKHYPVFLDLTSKHCLIIGGGKVAARKLESLIQCTTNILVVSPELSTEAKQLINQHKIKYVEAPFSADFLSHADLVIAATNDKALNKQISALAQKQKILVNVVDAPDLCSFILPAVIERLPIQIAISTGGSSPLLAQLLKSRLESLIPSAYGKLATLLANFRERTKHHFSDKIIRRRFWEKILHGAVAELVFAGKEEEAKHALEIELQHADNTQKTGEVYLVGAGPGSADLLTFRALRLMQQADVVLYDRLVSPEIINLVRKEAERIYVGKSRNLHTLPQQQINQILLEQAKLGKRVLRLKGGDPFIFGRGGEEIENLSENGISFQIVPGITAASGCASYAGIPLTHRDYAQSCSFITAHLKNSELNLDWRAFANPQQTLVIYMGLFGIDLLCKKLIEHGLSKSLPAALIEHGTTDNQRVFISDLTNLANKVMQAKVSSPSLIIVGEVVKLHEKLSWFKKTENKLGE